jgi:hypothetical protein
MTTERTIVLHYHLFKNAGTSLDKVLKTNFGARWVTKEFERRANPATHLRELEQWINANPEAVAFSSHTAELPTPDIPGVKVIPLIFVRHPIDRIASAYTFEHKQGGQGFGAVLARNTTLAGYAEVRLAVPQDRQCRNFQVARFSRMFGESEGTELERGLKAVRELPFVGIVEDFGGSMQRLEDLLKPHFPDFQKSVVAENVTRDVSRSLQSRIASLRAEMGDEVYDLLVASNSDDLMLHQSALDFAARKATQT